jgi:hypothetical protein
MNQLAYRSVGLCKNKEHKNSLRERGEVPHLRSPPIRGRVFIRSPSGIKSVINMLSKEVGYM